MTEFEIVQYITQHAKEHGYSNFIQSRGNIPLVESLLRKLPDMKLRIIMTPEAYTVGEVVHPKGDPVPISTLQDILEVFKNRRNELGFEKTKDIATLLGMDHTYYSRIEKEQYKMSLKLMLRICRMLWIDVKVEPADQDITS